ncbi:hypothetical protein OH77DRAFT_910334 [Trametes cingulata]|nr:hypothetical protein OH77DRAFT_910334 [Trametes cingulata]
MWHGALGHGHGMCSGCCRTTCSNTVQGRSDKHSWKKVATIRQNARCASSIPVAVRHHEARSGGSRASRATRYFDVRRGQCMRPTGCSRAKDQGQSSARKRVNVGSLYERQVKIGRCADTRYAMPLAELRALKSSWTKWHGFPESNNLFPGRTSQAIASQCSKHIQEEFQGPANKHRATRGSIAQNTEHQSREQLEPLSSEFWG